MRRTLLWRITVPFILLILFSVGGVSFYFSNYIENTYLDNLQVMLRTEARLLAQDVFPLLRETTEPHRLEELVAYYRQVTDARITIILPDGRVAAESHTTPESMENHLNRPEVRQALETGEGWQIRFSDTVKKRFYYLAVPVEENGRLIGIVRVGSSLEKIESDLADLRRAILTAGALTVLLAVLLGLVVSNRTIQPLRQLSRDVARLGLGEFRGRLPTYRKDEIGMLSQSFAEMAARLYEQIDSYREERTKLDAILRHMTDGIIIVDSQAKVQLINPAAERIFNTPADQAMGRSLAEVVRQYQVIDLWKKSAESNRQEINTLETSPDRLFVQAIATPLEPALPGSTLLVFQDLTRIRRLETVRRDFVSNVSHELRTPLASVKALSDTLQESALEDPPAARRFLQRMDHEIDNMTQLVRELLELSRIESGKVPLNRQAISPLQLLRNSVERMQVQAARNGLTLSIEAQEDVPAVLADADRIEQVLVNLLHNAIKFTPPGGQVILNAAKEGGYVVFSVRDTGVGIAADALPRIFERFYKADQSRSGGGTGLGLSIARHTVEAHDGRIWAESSPNQGTTIYFSLPLA